VVPIAPVQPCLAGVPRHSCAAMHRRPLESPAVQTRMCLNLVLQHAHKALPVQPLLQEGTHVQPVYSTDSRFCQLQPGQGGCMLCERLAVLICADGFRVPSCVSAVCRPSD
jgi:hypothetical protein